MAAKATLCSGMAFPPGPTQPTAWITYRWVREPYTLLEELEERFGDTFSMKIAGFPRMMIVSNPDHVREIFSDDGETLEAGRVNRTLAPLLGDRSVLMADGRDHLRKRKILLPPFHGERMQAYGRAMLELTDDGIDAFPVGAPFAIHGPMQDITLRIIVRTIFGFEEGPQTEKMVARTKRVLELGAWAPLLFPLMQFDLGRFSPFGRFRIAVAEADEMLYGEIARRRRDGARGPDILSMLLDAKDDAGRPMPDAELRDELVTLLVAGHETTATALAWAFERLTRNPRVLAELISEQRSADAGEEYLDAVVKETLRLRPVVPAVVRRLQAPMEFGGWELPAGVNIAPSIFLLHRRADLYPSPEEFRPERFLGDDAPGTYEWIPFGGGVRRCLGASFAMFEMKAVLRAALRTVRPRVTSARGEGTTRRAITFTPSGGAKVRLDPAGAA